MFVPPKQQRITTLALPTPTAYNHKPTKYAATSPSHSYVAPNANANDSAAVNGDMAQLPCHQLGLQVCFFQIHFFIFTNFFFTFT
jgi:hypothetical protein